MNFFKKTNDVTENVYWATRWDQQLLDAMFARVTEGTKFFGHRFTCLFELCETESKDFEKFEYKFKGVMQYWINDNTFSVIPVLIRFEEPDDDYDVHINQFDKGYLTFFGSEQIIGNRSHADMCLTLKNKNGFAEELYKKYVDLKASGRSGINVSWSVILMDLAGKSAEEIWGNGPLDIEYDDEGKRISDIPIGLECFALETVSFNSAF